MNARPVQPGARTHGHPRRRPRQAARALAGLLALLLAAPLAQPHEPAVERDHDADRRCSQCHAQEHIAELNPEERRSMVGSWLDVDTPPPADPAPVAPLAGDEPPLRPGLLVPPEIFAHGPHAAVACIDCHADAARLPHAATLAAATCTASCHADAAEAYESGSHRESLRREDPLAPTCATCHGAHDILHVNDRNAPQHKLNSLHLCGDCHSQHTATERETDPSGRVINYLETRHAQGVIGAGLLAAASCPDCHGGHAVLPSLDPDSPVHRSNAPETCGVCHVGVAEIYATSVHGKQHTEHNGEAAVCTDCHRAHRISLASSPSMVSDVISECGRCHDSPDANGDRVGTYYQSYHRSYHGQAAQLGGERAAKCNDCHGAHDILPLDDPASRVSAKNIVATCAECHPGANANFAMFDPHANYRDARNYPLLYGVWLYFVIMMSSVFTFFGLHTILWFLRCMIDRIRNGPAPKHKHEETAIRRFSGLNRFNHLLVAVTFFGLTATGIPLVFADDEWARGLAGLFGGVVAAGLWHRVFAVMLIINLVLHFIGLGLAYRRRSCTTKEWLFGPNTLLPRWKDVTDCFGMFRWFFCLGRRPSFDRWAYWEKFDYWAEIGGSMIIGGSGMLLWFPEIASLILPGWVFNVAMTVHGYEALLAIGFIFTIHFFNAHLRPGTFPVDEVIFTGSLPEHELKEHRPEEYRRLVESGRLEALRVKAPDPAHRPLILLVAAIAVGIGLALLALIIIGGLF